MENNELNHADIGEVFVSSLFHDDSNELYHYGVKGMKWGQHIFGKVKSGVTKVGRKTVELAKQANKSHKQRVNVKNAAKRAKITSAKKLTDEELTARIKRLELEQSYQKLLSSTEPDYVSSGKKIVKDIMENSLKNIGGQTMTYIMGAGVNKAAKTFFKGITEDIINPKKGQKDK